MQKTPRILIILSRYAQTLFLLLFLSSSVPASVIFNGDFEQGYSGFGTEYVYAPSIQPFPGLNGGEFNIVTNPYPFHFAAVSYGDHTSGSGRMMMVNADRNDNPDLMVWSQTVSVVPNSVYNFSAWISTWVVAGDLNISRLSFSINGESIGKQNAPGVTKVWEQFSASWNARGNTVANIQIYETGYEVGFLGGGNDFALDDISFVATSIAIPEPDSRTMYSIGFSFAGLFLHRRKKQSIKYFRG